MGHRAARRHFVARNATKNAAFAFAQFGALQHEALVPFRHPLPNLFARPLCRAFATPILKPESSPEDPLGYRVLSVMSAVYRLWASTRMAHVQP